MINIRTRNRLVAGIVVATVISLLLTGNGDRSPSPFKCSIPFIVTLLVTYAVFWIVDSYHLI